MSTWTTQDFERIGAAEELRLAPTRRDGALGKPVTIWVVPRDDDLYVRSVRGPNSGWFRGVRHHTQARAASAHLRS